MNRWTRLALCAVLLGLVGLGASFALNNQDATAADHTDAPAAAATPAGDIADFYAWHNNDTLTVAITFAALQAPGADQTGTYDSDVVYAIHIDNDNDGVADFPVLVRFGQNNAGNWGVKVDGLPGEDAAVIGAVETNIDGANNTKVFAGLRDDPFFFDFQGFNDTLATAAPAFDPSRDSFAGTNATAIVIEMPLSAALDGNADLQVWATTGTL